MPQCPECRGNQPDDDLLAIHRERFCPQRPKPVPVAVAPVPEDLFGPEVTPDSPSQNGSAPDQAAFTDVGIWFPRPDKNYILEAEQAATVERIMALADQAPANLLLTGPAGSGKTSLAKQMAAKYNRPFALIPFGKMQEVSQIFGERLFDPSLGTYYQKSLLWQAIETEGCVICLDEINRCENPKVANGLQNLLDDNRQTPVDELQTVLRVAPRVVFVLTMNEGLEYSGIDPFDTALRSRCRAIEMGYPPRDATIQVLVAKTGITAGQAIKLMNIVAPASGGGAPMRSLIFAGEFLKAGSTYRQAVLTGFSTLDKRELSGMLRRAQDADGGAEYVETWRAW